MAVIKNIGELRDLIKEYGTDQKVYLFETSKVDCLTNIEFYYNLDKIYFPLAYELIKSPTTDTDTETYDISERDSIARDLFLGIVIKNYVPTKGGPDPSIMSVLVKDCFILADEFLKKAGKK